MNNPSIDLIKKAKAGNISAVEEFFTLLKPFVANTCSKFFLAGCDTEDVLQEGMIGLHRALISFNETKNDNFLAYAHLCIKRQIINAIKKNNSQAQLMASAFSIDDDNGAGIKLIAEFSSNAETFEDVLLQENSINNKIQNSMIQLSSFEKQVLCELLSGKKQSAIAATFGQPVKKIENALSRIRSKLKNTKNEN